MADASAVRVTPRRTPARRARTASSRHRRGAVRHLLLAILAAPPAVRLLLAGLIAVALWWPLNWAYQVVRKPTELFFPVSGALSKTPAQDRRKSRPALPRALHGDHDARPAGRSGAGRGRGQPGGADVLAVATVVESLRALPAGLERGRHVPDHRSDLPGSQALLRSRSRGGGGRRLERSESRAGSTARIFSGRAESRGRADRRTAGSHSSRARWSASTSRARPCGSRRIWPPSSISAGRARGSPTPGRGFRLTPGQKCGDHDVAPLPRGRQRAEAAVPSTRSDRLACIRATRRRCTSTEAT